MASDRIQRQIERLLDEAEEAITNEDWALVASRARAVLRLNPESSDALSYLAAAERDAETSQSQSEGTGSSAVPLHDQPTSFANGRYQVTAS